MNSAIPRQQKGHGELSPYPFCLLLELLLCRSGRNQPRRAHIVHNRAEDRRQLRQVLVARRSRLATLAIVGVEIHRRRGHRRDRLAGLVTRTPAPPSSSRSRCKSYPTGTLPTSRRHIRSCTPSSLHSPLPVPPAPPARTCPAPMGSVGLIARRVAGLRSGSIQRAL
jgi:hypothetical protein